MKLCRTLATTALAVTAACASIPDVRVADARTHCDATRALLESALVRTDDVGDETEKTLRLQRITHLNDQLAYSEMLMIMSSAVPDREGFDLAERSFTDIQRELLTLIADR